jgi:hypothetical protein
MVLPFLVRSDGAEKEERPWRERRDAGEEERRRKGRWPPPSKEEETATS